MVVGRVLQKERSWHSSTHVTQSHTGSVKVSVHMLKETRALTPLHHGYGVFFTFISLCIHMQPCTQSLAEAFPAISFVTQFLLPISLDGWVASYQQRGKGFLHAFAYGRSEYR